MPLPIEKQVVGLDLAKKLKELDVKQESVFRWVIDDHQRPEIRLRNSGIHPWDLDEYSAFTVAELGEMLPPEYLTMRHPTGWAAYDGDGEYVLQEKTEADARAKMLVYLIENDLIKADQINPPSPDA
jgi:hypothetical protein